MASNISITIKLLCVSLLIKCVHSEYIPYYIQYYCDQHPDRRILISDEGNYSALILRSSNGQTISNQKCKVKIIGQQITGFIAAVEHISLNSSNCEDYLKFDNNIKWCQEKDANSVTVNKTELDIEFGTGNDSTSQFELIITTFTGNWNRTCPKANNIRCHGGKQECIFNGFECDGYSNCPFGSDEKECPNLVTQPIDESQPDEDSQDIDPELTANSQTNQTIESFSSSTQLNTSTTIVSTNFTTKVSASLSTTINSSATTTNETSSTTANSTSSTTTENSTTFSTTINSTTTQKPTETTQKPKPTPNEGISGFETALLIIAIIILVIVVAGSAIYMYKKQNNSQEALYSPL